MATLQTYDLTKSYGGRTVVRGVSVEVRSGEVVGLLGPNGAGKTTTFYMTVGLTAPDSGRVVLNGEDVTSDPMYVRARKGIGYLPQEPSIFRGLTVEQNILAILETMGLNGPARRTRLRELLAELNLTPLARAPAQRDPVDIPGAGLPVANGPTVKELGEAIEIMFEYPKASAFGVASYPAARDPEKKGLKSVYTLIESAIRGTNSRAD
jgi:ABC-type glutathione transport system ATPase component